MINLQNEFWLRRDARFHPRFNSTTGMGAAFRLEVNPSQFPNSQFNSWPTTAIILGLNGRGTFEFENGDTFFVEKDIEIRIPANTRFLMRNLLRQPWETYWFLNGDLGCESIIEALSMTNDEREIERQAKAVGVGTYFPAAEPPPIAAIQDAQNRIAIPLGSSFSL